MQNDINNNNKKESIDTNAIYFLCLANFSFLCFIAFGYLNKTYAYISIFLTILIYFIHVGIMLKQWLTRK